MKFYLLRHVYHHAPTVQAYKPDPEYCKYIFNKRAKKIKKINLNNFHNQIFRP